MSLAFLGTAKTKLVYLSHHFRKNLLKNPLDMPNDILLNAYKFTFRKHKKFLVKEIRHVIGIRFLWLLMVGCPKLTTLISLLLW